jgi:hypothetical protein
MPKESHDLDRAVRTALTNASAVWTEQCPEPETLLDWIDREEVHPQAAALLDHVIFCAYCRGEFAEMCELRGRVPISARPVRPPSRIATWVAELIREGFTLPIRSMRPGLQTLRPAFVSRSLNLGGGIAAPTGLRPAWTKVRTPSPTLRWSAEQAAPEYIVTIRQKKARKPEEVLWESSAGRERDLIIPSEAGLEPGGLYLWLVTAVIDGMETSSVPVSFSVLTKSTRCQLEALEPFAEEGTPERVALYEAFGLYDEALHQAGRLDLGPGNEKIAQRIRQRLEEHLFGPAYT